MKKYTFVIFLMTALHSFCQDVRKDSLEIVQILEHYVKSIYEVDTSRVYIIADSSLQKSGHYYSPRNQNWSYHNMDFAGLVETAATYNKKGWVPQSAPLEIEIFEIRDKVASAKVSAIWGFDYVLLSKHSNGTWKMDKVLWQSYTAADIRRIQLRHAYTDSVKTEELSSINKSVSNMYKPCWGPDNKTLYFFQKQGKEDYRIYETVKNGNEWSTPTVVNIGDSTESNLYPTISPDGKRLVFTSYRENPIGYTANAYIWMATKKGDGWSAPVFLKELNKDDHYYSNLAFTNDGKLIYRETSADWSDSKTYVATPAKKGFENTQIYAPVENWKNELDGYYLWGGIPHPNEDIIILDVSALNKNGDKLPSDQWISYKDGENWTAPKPIGKGVNQKGSWDTFPFFNAAADTLYFVRDFESIHSIAVSLIR